jgi:hypothetical protein
VNIKGRNFLWIGNIHDVDTGGYNVIVGGYSLRSRIKMVEERVNALNENCKDHYIGYYENNKLKRTISYTEAKRILKLKEL